MSDEIGIEFDFEKHRTDWLKRLGDELIKLGPTMPLNFLPEDEECPLWVRRVEEEFGAAMFPVAKIKEATHMTPRLMGALLGHECAMAVWTMQWLQKEFERPDNPEQLPLTEEQLKQGAEAIGSIIEKWYPGMRRLAKIALCSAVDQTYEDMRDFLLAFSAGFARKPNTFEPGNMGSTTFETYLLLLVSWRAVVCLKSVSQLHNIFVKVFGPYRTGDLKRTEKLCQRIGLSFRKPGRPKKLPIIQTPA